MAKPDNKTLEVLIDTGINNNFILESFASKLNAPLEETKCFKVFDLLLQGHQFEVDLYVLSLCGLDVVFGMQWLQTLGSCVHDHKTLTMDLT
ncbi:hypothetical protein G4B88_008499 [Cannabis sativa]|uniref:Uncharacterized protein n=1 Tax=Cannabis sativa TaxID=3483 RepID=A0A7J6DRF9_CANSA|nr:hypothetical protein G4B88_008499 [Cannabis sativa]